MAHRVGSALFYWILTKSGQIISRTAVNHVTQVDIEKDEVQSAITDYHLAIEAFFGANGNCYAGNGDQFDK